MAAKSNADKSRVMAADKIALQREHYDDIARDFDVRYNRANPNHMRKIDEIGRAFFDNLPPKPEGYDFLELGGGTGIHAESFLRNNLKQIRSFTLSDLSEAMLDEARKRLRDFQVNYFASPAEEIATTQTFDGIYVSGAMHHFTNPAAAIASMHERLRPSGVLVICEPIVWNPVNFVKAAINSLEWGQFRITRQNVGKMLSEQGYRVVTSRVLHWRGDNRVSDLLWPYERLKSVRWLNYAAVMFLIAAIR